MICSINRRIKVIHVITRMDWGGSPDILRILFHYLDKDVFDLRLVMGKTLHPSQTTSIFLNKIKNRLEVIPWLIREVNPIYDVGTFFRLVYLFIKYHPDIVHTHTAKAGALGRLAARIAGVPVVIHTPHGHNFYGYFNPLISWLIILAEKFLSFFCDKIIALTKLERDDYIKHRVADKKKFVLIYHGLELDKYEQAEFDRLVAKNSFKISEDTLVVGMIGRLEPVKGPQYFMDAAIKILSLNIDVVFILAGEGSMRRELQEKARQLSFQDKIIFTGWLHDTRSLFSILDILILPSLNEAVGMVLIEAQSQGIPVVATRVGGVPEVVKDQITGFLVPPARSDLLAEAALRLLNSRELRFQLGQAGRNWVKDKFNTTIMSENISNLYKQLIII
ncbi:MAG: glycosyltransferase family 4 protein [Candidatus Omnitrophica bacterium]|nr:glycosyltransferase family 4 protein [Candidatus Omnitrophota bacterium]